MVSVAIALKNVILMSLIVLIFHFLLKNLKLEKQRKESKSKACVPYTQVTIEQQTCGNRDDDDSSEEEMEHASEQARKNPVEELHKFVFDDKDAIEDIEKFYIPVSNDPKFEEEYEIACDTNVEEKKKVDAALIKLANKKDKYKNKELAFIKEYKENDKENDKETMMTGGDFVGLMAFDAYDSTFGEI